MTPNNKDKSTKVVINILKEDYDDLLSNANSDGLTLGQYLSKALAIQKYVDSKLKTGAIFLVEKNGYQRDIIFK